MDAALLAADGPGAVSAPVAEALAVGVRRVAGTTFGIGMTGIAGPTGGSDEKPVGLVFIGVATPGGARVERFLFGGSHGRELIRERAARTALNRVLRIWRSGVTRPALGRVGPAEPTYAACVHPP